MDLGKRERFTCLILLLGGQMSLKQVQNHRIYDVFLQYQAKKLKAEFFCWILSLILCKHKKTVCRIFSTQQIQFTNSNIFLANVELELGQEYKYLGVFFTPPLLSKTTCRKPEHNTIKLSLHDFRHIGPSVTITAARMVLPAVVLSHIIYCFTIWTPTSSTTPKMIESLYKNALKYLPKHITGADSDHGKL